MKVRRFNNNGIRQMGEFIDSLTTDNPQTYPKNILTDLACTEIIKPEIELKQRSFENRFEVGEYFKLKFDDVDINDIERDRGLWSWLALYYFDELCNTDSNGNPKPGERARWIPEIWDFRKYYRHLLAGPYRIFSAYSEEPSIAYSLLCTPPYQPGEVVEQLTSRQELVTNSSIVEASTKLYFDKQQRGHKRGAAGKGPGSARRLADIVSQLELTWDLYSLSTNEILGILPTEFNRFKSDK